MEQGDRMYLRTPGTFPVASPTAKESEEDMWVTVSRRTTRFGSTKDSLPPRASQKYLHSSARARAVLPAQINSNLSSSLPKPMRMTSSRTSLAAPPFNPYFGVFSLSCPPPKCQHCLQSKHTGPKHFNS